jgi:hypothetical protein
MMTNLVKTAYARGYEDTLIALGLTKEAILSTIAKPIIGAIGSGIKTFFGQHAGQLATKATRQAAQQTGQAVAPSLARRGMGLMSSPGATVPFHAGNY